MTIENTNDKENAHIKQAGNRNANSRKQQCATMFKC